MMLQFARGRTAVATGRWGLRAATSKQRALVCAACGKGSRGLQSPRLRVTARVTGARSGSQRKFKQNAARLPLTIRQCAWAAGGELRGCKILADKGSSRWREAAAC
jgi:hypothetical protein